LVIRDGRNNDLRKISRFPKGMEENFCEVLEFIQLFATSSLDEIEFDYKSNVARQFIMRTKRQGGLVNNNIPCLIISQIDHQIIWIPNEQELD